MHLRAGELRMAISGNEKVKVQRSVLDISKGEFDERDIDHVLMALRAHSGKSEIFKEVSHFVAHNDIRDKGITTNSLEAFYLSFKYFSEYVTLKNPLKIEGPFPSYIIKLMKYQIDKCKEGELRKRFNVTKNRLKSRIDNLFKIDKNSNTAELKKRLSETNFLAIKHILGFIGSHPAFTQKEIISEFIEVLRINGVEFEDEEIRNQGDRIMLCILSLVHNTEYNFGGHKNGFCSISCDKHSIPHESIFVDENGNPVEVDISFGKLQVNGTVPNINKGREVMVAFPVITTELDVESWCDDSLFHIDVSGAGFKSKCVSFDGGVGVNSQFKLVGINA